VPRSLVVSCTLALALAGASCADAPAERSDATARTAPSAPHSTVATVTTTTAPPAPASPTSLEISLQDYAIVPAASVVPAGELVITVVNGDRAPHDVTILRTALPASQLPTAGISVDESDPALEILARTPRLDPLGTGTITTALGPGTYVLVCTVPHHYVREAMVAVLTVSS
jgi:uncharacterized cupredoxin-like copper-binding protein